jgi:hypothetical protein
MMKTTKNIDNEGGEWTDVMVERENELGESKMIRPCYYRLSLETLE